MMLGVHEDLMWAEKIVNARTKMKRTGLLGPDPGDDKEVSCLSRILRWSLDHDRIEWEADPRHASITIKQIGLNAKNSKGVVTPGVSVAPDAASPPLSPSERSIYRSITMRTAYQSVDRPELLFAAKEAARNMQNPTKQDFEKIMYSKVSGPTPKSSAILPKTEGHQEYHTVLRLRPRRLQSDAKIDERRHHDARLSLSTRIPNYAEANRDF